MSSLNISVLLALHLAITGLAPAQDDRAGVQNEIAQLLQGLTKSAVSGAPIAQFFSPTARVSQKAVIEKLQTKPFTSFEFTDYSLKELELEDPQHASLPVTVKWSTRTEEASSTATLKFVKDQGSWYLA